MSIKRLVVGQIKTNCYLVYSEKTKDSIIVDPGDDAQYIINTISDLSLKPSLIVATHGHFDHILAVTEIKLAYNIPFLLHNKDEFLLSRMQASARHFLGIRSDPSPRVDGYLVGGNNIKLSGFDINIVHTPGHTPGSCTFIIVKKNILFSGDLIFADGMWGRTDFKYGDRNKLVNSINLIKKSYKDYKVFSGHGENFRL